MKLQAPCKDCEKRYMGCHSKCAEYIEYDKHQQKIRDERVMKAEEVQMMVRQITESRKRMKRGKIK